MTTNDITYEVQMWQPPQDQWQPEGTWHLLRRSHFDDFAEAEQQMLDKIGPEWPKGRIIKVVVNRTVVCRAGHTDGSDAGIIDAIEKGIIAL